MKERPDCEYCGWGKQLRIQHAYGERKKRNGGRRYNLTTFIKESSCDNPRAYRRLLWPSKERSNKMRCNYCVIEVGE